MKKKTVEYGKYGYMFIAPFFLVFLVFQLYPLIYTFYLSFVEYYQRKGKMVGPNFNGLKNYLMVLADTKAVDGHLEVVKWFDTKTVMSIKNTLIIWVLNFIPQMLLALLLSSWFTDTVVKLKGQGAFKVMMFMPNIITASSIAVLFYSLFNIQGPITIALKNIGIIKDAGYDFMEHAAPTIGLIAFMQFWMWYGNTMIVLIAGILGISPSLYEAAMVDGATGRQQFFSITLPLLKPIIQFTLVTSVIGGLQMYDIPSLFNVDQSFNGKPNFASETITMWIKALGFTNKDYGRAASSSIILFIVTLLISTVFLLATREKVAKKSHAVIR